MKELTAYLSISNINIVCITKPQKNTNLKDSSAHLSIYFLQYIFISRLLAAELLNDIWATKNACIYRNRLGHSLHDSSWGGAPAVLWITANVYISLQRHLDLYKIQLF